MFGLLDGATDEKLPPVGTERTGIVNGDVPAADEEGYYRDITAGRDGVWDTTGERLGRVEADQIGIDQSRFESVEAVEAGRQGIVSSEIDEVGRVSSEWEAVLNSEIDEIGTLVSEHDGIDGSTVGECRFLEVDGTAVRKSEVEEIGLVHAGLAGVQEAEVDTISVLLSDGYGIVHPDTEVGYIGFMEAEMGVREAAVGAIDSLIAEQRIAVDAEIDRVGNAVAPIYESDDEDPSYGFCDCEVGVIESLTVSKYAVEDSEVETLGDVKAAWNGIIRSTVDRVEGDLLVENYPVQDATIGTVHGDIETDTTAITNTTIDAIYGDILAGETLFDTTDMAVVVAETVTAETLAEDAYGNLIVADRVTTDDPGEGTIVITDADDEFLDYAGDLSDLKQLLEDDPSALWPLQVFQPEMEEPDREALLGTVADFEHHLEDLGRDRVRDCYGAVADYRFLGPADFGQVIAAYDDEFEEIKKQRVEAFGDILQQLDETHRDRLVSLLETPDETVGRDLYTVARDRPFFRFIDDPAAAVEAIITVDDDRTYDIDPFLDESPYRNAFQAALDTYSAAVADALQMAEAAGQELILSVEKRLKKWEGERRSRGNGRTIDQDELEKELAKELAKKTRSYTMDALQQLGRGDAAAVYEERLGGSLDSEKDVAALTAHDEYIFNRDAIADIVAEEDVYGLPENERWRNDYGIDAGTLRTGMGEQEYDVAGETVTVWLASPEETLRMGDYFADSCFAIGKVRGWHPAAMAIDANKHVVYAENENGNIIGRQAIAFTEEEELATYSMFTNVDDPVDDAIEQYVSEWAETLGYETVEQEKDVALLEAERWHDRAL